MRFAKVQLWHKNGQFLFILQRSCYILYCEHQNYYIIVLHSFCIITRIPTQGNSASLMGYYYVTVTLEWKDTLVPTGTSLQSSKNSLQGRGE